MEAFSEARLRRRVDKALEVVRKVLANTKRPELSANVPHQYDDKFLLAEQLTNGSIAAQVNALAEIYGNSRRGTVSLWCMGVNQHVRGTWMNNLINDLHLITGKISRPGSNPLSLTGQPSACGTAREVGTLSNRLPADMVVTNAEQIIGASGSPLLSRRGEVVGMICAHDQAKGKGIYLSIEKIERLYAEIEAYHP